MSARRTCRNFGTGVLKTRRVWKLDRAVPARPSLSGSAFPATMIIQRGGIPNNGTGAAHQTILSHPERPSSEPRHSREEVPARLTAGGRQPAFTDR